MIDPLNELRALVIAKPLEPPPVAGDWDIVVAETRNQGPRDAYKLDVALCCVRQNPTPPDADKDFRPEGSPRPSGSRRRATVWRKTRDGPLPAPAAQAHPQA